MRKNVRSKQKLFRILQYDKERAVDIIFSINFRIINIFLNKIIYFIL